MQATLCTAAVLAPRGLKAGVPRRASQRLVVRAAASKDNVQDAVVKATTLAGISAALLSAGSAQAAMEVANIAAGSDNRFGTIALLAVPVLGWVGFNILQPAQNQLNAMKSGEYGTGPAAKKGGKKARGVAAGLGLTAAGLLASQSAEAAQQVADLAASDNRFGTIALLAVPVLGWVLFNILQPAQNQLAAMQSGEYGTGPAAKKGGKKARGVAAGLGLTAAGLLATQSAEAAQQVADLAASDNRFGTIALLAVPVLGWVLFNILQPAQNQLAAMQSGEYGTGPAAKKGGKKARGVAAGLGLTAAGLLATQSAEAAQQVADLAASDNRFGTIALLAVPVLGWVLFNILQPAQNQLAAMQSGEYGTGPAAKKGGKKARGVAAGLGLTAAGLLATQSAEAAQQVADLAASDNRFGTIALLAVPVLGWVGFNILGPLQNQLNAMQEEKPKAGRRK